MTAGSDHILAGDLAPALPAMAALPADTPLGLAPFPGVARIFTPAELRMLAARFHLAATPSSQICIERPVLPLEPDRLLEAMHQTLPEARIEILDFSRQPAPAGRLEFSIAGLRPGPAGGFWAGAVRYGENRRFFVWARVKVAVKVHRVLAIGDLHPGTSILPGQVQAVEREEFPCVETFAASAGEVTGKWPRLLIRAGSAIRAAQLEAPKEVARGDIVTVEVRNGAALLKLEAQAEGPGAAGESILVRNPTSQKSFRARVEGKGRVSVDASALPAPVKVNP